MSPELEGTSITVPKERYLEILAFTMYSYFENKITPYSRIGGGKRALGEYIEDFIYGKVAEVAFQEFLKKQLNLEVLTDLDTAEYVEGEYLPDIIAVKKDGEYEIAKFWVEIKEVRRDQRWLLIPASAVEARPYDAYVAVWVGLPDEHIAWLVKSVPEVSAKLDSEWERKIAEIESSVNQIQCKVIGTALWNDIALVKLASSGDVTAQEKLNSRYGLGGWFYFSREKNPLYDPDDPKWKGSEVSKNVGFALRRLAKATDWNKLYELIIQNERLVIEQIPIKGKGKKGIPKVCESISTSDYRDLSVKCLEVQLDIAKKKYGSIRRSVSWFAHPLKSASQAKK